MSMLTKRILCIVLTLMLLLTLTGSAIAELSVLPDLHELAGKPLDVRVSVSVAAHQPLDDVRTGWLDALLAYHELRFTMAQGNDASIVRMAVAVDSSQAFDITMREGADGSQLRTSLLPDVTLSAGDGDRTALDLLLGNEPDEDALLPLPQDTMLLRDAETMLGSLQTSYPDRFETKKQRNTINGYGNTTLTRTWTVKAEDAAAFGEILLQCCPEGWLRMLLGGITFTGTQTVTILIEDDGTIHKVSWTGTIGIGGEQATRKVNLTWRLSRTDTQTRDELTLKCTASQANTGEQYTLNRKIAPGKSGITDATTFTFERTRSGRKDSVSVDWNLLRKDTDGESVITGTGKVQIRLTGNVRTQYSLKLNAAVDRSGVISADLQVQLEAAGHVLEDATFHITAAQAQTAPMWQVATATDLDGMAEEELTALRGTLLERAEVALLSHWVLLPTEATLYLSQDIPEEVWQQICYAALPYVEEED